MLPELTFIPLFLICRCSSLFCFFSRLSHFSLLAPLYRVGYNIFETNFLSLSKTVQSCLTFHSSCNLRYTFSQPSSFSHSPVPSTQPRPRSSTSNTPLA
ncbi:hypothetical protein EDD21DRAFT_370099 [Dissophora ornata]|nr:hypothetical protein EDD21DRAFT_370099 [Dissophora ornata]